MRSSTPVSYTHLDVYKRQGLDILSITTSEDNLRSRRVIEKCGFEYEGTLRYAYKIYDGTIEEIRCYSMMKQEYIDMKKRGWCDV